MGARKALMEKVKALWEQREVLSLFSSDSLRETKSPQETMRDKVRQTWFQILF